MRNEDSGRGPAGLQRGVRYPLHVGGQRALRDGVVEGPVGGDHTASVQDRERKVEGIVHGTPHADGQVERRLHQGLGGLDGDGRGEEGVQDVSRFASAQLTSSDFLPEDVGELGKEKVRAQQLVFSIQKMQRPLAVDLRNVLFGRDARIDHVPAHRRRSSATSAALSLCRRPASRLRMRAARARASSTPTPTACSRTLFTSACSERPWRRARDLRRSTTAGSRFRTSTCATSVPLPLRLIAQ